MNPKIFSEWISRQGYIVYKTESSYWYNQGFKALQAFPYHWQINPDVKELDDLLKHAKALTLRYSTPVTSCEGKISYHAYLEAESYNIDMLGKWARKNVRRGMKNCEVRKISFEQLAKEGYELQINTLSRQGRKLNLMKEEWQTRCLAASDLPGFDAWGALIEGKLTASVITFQMNDCGYMLYQQCHCDYLGKHVNNALSFIVTSELLARSEINSILYGLHSLDAPSSVDKFKFRMGYSAQPVRQRVVFNPKVEPFFNNFTHVGLKAAHGILSGNPALAKAEGMLRFYLQGKRPLAEQDWPEALLKQKDAILAQISK